MGFSPFAFVAKAWMNNIQKAKERKEKEFDPQAEESMSFFDGAIDQVFSAEHGKFKSGNGDIEPPQIQMRSNRVFEIVSILRPMIANKNPVFSVNPRKALDFDPEILDFIEPQLLQALAEEQMETNASDRIVCHMLERYLNYLPNETGFRNTLARIIVETLIKGMSHCFTEVHLPPGASKWMVRSKWINADRVVWDPDATCYEDIQWIAVECREPTSVVEAKYPYCKGHLKGKYASFFEDSKKKAAGTQGMEAQGRGETYDITCYWKVYSKIGIGKPTGNYGVEGQEVMDEVFGPYVFLAVSKNCPFPLNLGPELCDKDPLIDPEAMALIREAVSWGVPHWLDGAWPVETNLYHESPDKLYPMAHIAPAIGQQYFLDWVMSMVATKIWYTCRTIIGLSEESSQWEDELRSGKDLVVLKGVRSDLDWDKILKVFQFPQMNPDIFNVWQQIKNEQDLSTGMSPMIYGSQGQRQVRSSAEATALQGGVNIRPEEMREQTEEFITRVGRRQAMTARLFIQGQDVEPIFGRAGAAVWDRYVLSTDAERVAREYEYRLESGSMNKPNKENLVGFLRESMQFMAPILKELAMANPENIQVLDRLFKDIAKATGNDWPYSLKPPLPPPPPMPPQGPPPEEQQGPPPEMQGPPPEMMPPPDMQPGMLPPELAGIPPELLAQMLQGGEMPPELAGVPPELLSQMIGM